MSQPFDAIDFGFNTKFEVKIYQNPKFNNTTGKYMVCQDKGKRSKTLNGIRMVLV